MQWYYFFPLGNWDSFICSFCVTWPLRDAKIHLEAESRVWFLLKSFAQSEIKPFLSSHIVLKKLFLRIVWLSSIFFPCLFFVLSFIFILLILLHRVFLRNKTIPRCFVFLFGCCTLNIVCALQDLSFCCLNVMIWKPDVILIGILSHTTSSIWVFQRSVTYPVLLKFRAIPHVPRNICTTYQFVSTKYLRNKTDTRVNIHYEIALLRYKTLKKFWGKNLRGLGIYASFSPPAPHSRYTFNGLKITNELIPVLKKRVCGRHAQRVTQSQRMK